MSTNEQDRVQYARHQARQVEMDNLRHALSGIITAGPSQALEKLRCIWEASRDLETYETLIGELVSDHFRMTRE